MIEAIAAKVNAKKKGKAWEAVCPCHDDKKPSLRLTETPEGNVLVYCHAGCKTDDVLSALGLKYADLFSTPLEKQEPVYYTYTDQEGRPTIRKVRKAGKKFFIEGLHGSAWLTGMNGHKPELYNVCQVLTAVKQGKAIWLVEGEKDADCLISKKAVATTNFDGAGKWQQRYTETLRGANVVIVADNDEPGIAHAKNVASQLKGSCKVKLVRAKEGKDAYDHFAFGHGIGDFVPLEDERPKLYDPKDIVSLADVQPEFPRFLHEPYIRFGTTNLYDARGGSGKTTTALAYCATASRGYTPEGEEIEPFTCLYFGKEDSAGELRAKFEEIGGDGSRFKVYAKAFTLDNRGREMVCQMIADTGAKMVVCDPIKSYLPSMRNQYDETELGPHLAAIRDEVARPMDVAWVNVRHFAKVRGGVGYDELSEAGQGNECWRDTHRSQLVGIPLPKPRYGCAIFHMKGSIMTMTGQPFGWEFSRGEFKWIPPSELDLSWLKGYTPSGRPPEKRGAAEKFLKANMVGGIPMDRDSLIERGKSEGCSQRTLYRAADALGMRKDNTAEGVKWTLPDPFGDNNV